MTARNSKRDRMTCLKTHSWETEQGRILMTCHICDGDIDVKRDSWEADHIIRRVLSGDDSAENIAPAHTKCHRGKDSKTSQDIRENAKGKRVRNKATGVERKSGFLQSAKGAKFNWQTGRYERRANDR
jgi:5-methylcytosine-specific restriction protein A